MSPAITVLMATYNRGRHIQPSIRSVLGQTFTDFELLVIGDGCNDDTESHVSAFRDPRIQWLNLPERGGSQSFANNAGLQIARAPIIAYIGHDDIWAPEHLAGLKELLDGSEVDFAVAGAIFHMPPGCKGHQVTGLFEDHSAALQHFFPPSSFAHSKSAADLIGPWLPPLEVRAPVDADFLLRAAKAGLRFRSTGKITVHKFAAGHRYLSYLQHDSSEQEGMLASFPDPEHARRVENIVQEAKQDGTFMVVRYPDFSVYEPGQLARENWARKGLDRQEMQSLGKQPLTLPQRPGPCALDWSDEVTDGYRYHNQNPNPALLLSVKSFWPVKITLQLKHHMVLRLISGSINGRPFRKKPLRHKNQKTELVLHARLRTDGPSILRLNLTPDQCRQPGVRGLGVGSITIRRSWVLQSILSLVFCGKRAGR